MRGVVRPIVKFLAVLSERGRPAVRLGSAVGRSLLLPSVVGALYVALLAAWAARSNVDSDEQLGHDAQQLTDFVQGRFGGEVTRVVVAVLAAAVVLGALLGAMAGALVRLRTALAGKPAPSAARLVGESAALTVVGHALLEAWGMAGNPQLYDHAFYARGGVLRTVEVVVTDVLGPAGVAWLAVLLVVAYLAGPPSGYRAWPGRVRELVPVARAWLRRRGAAHAATGLGVLAAALLASGFRAPDARPPAVAPSTTGSASAVPGTRPNVVILAADSLRADRIRPDVAPHLEALAERAVRFDRAYVSLPRTFPSWVNLLTGRHAHHHGIRSMFPRWEDRAKDFDALPERLARAGYATGVVSDFAGDIFSRIDLGFGLVDAPTFNFRQLVRQRALERETPLLSVLHSRIGRAAFPVLRELNDAADPQMLTRDAVRAIEKLEGRPFFLTVFYSTAHFPYAAPAPWYGRFTSSDYRGRYKYDKPVGLGHEAAPDPDDVRQVRALYDGAVASIDAAMQGVLDALDRDGLSDDTIVIVTGDHGETLYENGHPQGHGDHLFGDEGTHVPLLVFDPRTARQPGGARRVASIVRDVDLAPTVYELTGVAPPTDLDGRSLVPALRGERLPERFAYAETELWFTEAIPGLPASMRLPYPGVARLTEVDAEHDDEVVLQKAMRPLTTFARHRMVRDARYKLVYVPTRAGVKYLLFDTATDPGETREVGADHPDVLLRLKAALWDWMLEDPEMTEKDGFLVPRDTEDLAATRQDPHLVRLDDPTQAVPAAEGAP